MGCCKFYLRKIGQFFSLKNYGPAPALHRLPANFRRRRSGCLYGERHDYMERRARTHWPPVGSRGKVPGQAGLDRTCFAINDFSPTISKKTDSLTRGFAPGPHWRPRPEARCSPYSQPLFRFLKLAGMCCGSSGECCLRPWGVLLTQLRIQDPNPDLSRDRPANGTHCERRIMWPEAP
jgi:hypothetical protein